MAGASRVLNVVPLTSRAPRGPLVHGIDVHSRCRGDRLELAVRFIGAPLRDPGVAEAALVMSDGRPRPAWLRQTGPNTFAGRCPPEAQLLEFKARAWTLEEVSCERLFALDTATGAITWRPASSMPPALFIDQVRKFSELSDEGAGELGRLLSDEAVNSS